MNDNINQNAGNAKDDNIEHIRQPKSKTPLIAAVIILAIAIIVLMNSMVISLPTMALSHLIQMSLDYHSMK